MNYLSDSQQTAVKQLAPHLVNSMYATSDMHIAEMRRCKKKVSSAMKDILDLAEAEKRQLNKLEMEAFDALSAGIASLQSTH